MTFQPHNNREYLHLGKLLDRYCYLLLTVTHVPENNSQMFDQVLLCVMERQENLIRQRKRLLSFLCLRRSCSFFYTGVLKSEVFHTQNKVM